jgi:hypothetical protein
MKTSLFSTGSALFILLAMAACSPDSGMTPGIETGAGGNASGGTTGTAGAATAGTTGAAGTTSTGGTAAGGTTSTGGSATGGTTSTGGSAGHTTGTGGSAAGTPGTGGTTNGAGGTAAAGTTGNGGSKGGSTGTGGSSGGATGTAGASGGGGSGSLLGIVGAFDGFLFTAPCGDGGTGYDCLNTGCTNGSPKTTMMDFPIGGTPGVKYNVTVRVKGVVEAKNYSGCTRAVTGNLVYDANGGNLWCSGGTIPDSTYNSYEINVFSQASGGTAMGGYRLNARDGTSEGHQSWPLNYEATFTVIGGGRIQWRVFDSNCRQIMNCGPGAGSSTCMSPVTINLAGATPAAPTSFMQPFRGTGATASAYGQWVFIDVTNVVAAP